MSKAHVPSPASRLAPLDLTRPSWRLVRSRGLAIGARLSRASTLGLALGLGLGLLGLGCNSGDQSLPAASSTASSSTYLTCATDPRARPFMPGMKIASQAGTFSVKVLESLESATVKGMNEWTVEIKDAVGAAATAVDGLDLSVVPTMPDHGHGTQAVTVTPKGAGKYALSPVYLFMSGYWEVKLNIKPGSSAASAPDQAVVPICVS